MRRSVLSFRLQWIHTARIRCLIALEHAVTVPIQAEWNAVNNDQSVAIVAGDADCSVLEEVSTEITNHADDITRVVFWCSSQTFDPGEWRCESVAFPGSALLHCAQLTPS